MKFCLKVTEHYLNQKRQNTSMRRGQAWSVDLVVGVLIFLLVIGLFYSLLSRNINDDTTQLKVESETVANKLSDNTMNSLLTNGEVDPEKMKTFTEKEISELKAELGVNNDFCIFFEDDTGNIVPIIINDSGTQKVYYSIGSKEINVSGHECGTQIGP